MEAVKVDPAPMPLSVLIEQANEDQEARNAGEAGRRKKGHLRRQRSKSLTEAQPRLGGTRAKESKNKRRSMRGQRSKSNSDLMEAAKNDPAPTPPSVLIEQANGDQDGRNAGEAGRRKKGPIRRQRSQSLTEAQPRLGGTRAKESKNKRK